jgi:hypothetical protein
LRHAALALLAVWGLTACGQKYRDPDLYIWRKAGWDPRQEDRDYGECYERAKKAAYRKYYWRRTTLSREVDNPSAGMSPGTIMNMLQEIAEDEKLATVEIAEDCMNGKGYRLMPVNEWRR